MDGDEKPDIRIRSQKGLNSHQVICRWCGRDTNKILLLNAHHPVFVCNSCKLNYYDHPRDPPTICRRCGSHEFTKRTLSENEKIPDGLCDECVDWEKELSDEVARGGVYYKCERCNSGGVIAAKVEMTKIVRRKLGIKPPKPVWIKVPKCPDCSIN